MAIIKDTENFENWLNGRPEESRVAEAKMLAARCALWILPYIEMYYFASNQKNKNLIFMTFRANTISWAAATYTAHDMALAAYNAADALTDDAENAAISDTNAAIIVATYAAAADTAHANATNAAVDAAANNNDDDVFWEMLSDDCARLEEGTKPTDLITQPLWQGYIPDHIQEKWRALKTMLLEDEAFKDEHWSVWTRWYEDRLSGRSANEGFEVARSQQPKEFWKNEPKIVNQKILELELEHNPPPAQVAGALTFKADENGIVDTAPRGLDGQHSTDANAQKQHAQIKKFAEKLQNRIISIGGMHNDPDFLENINDFLECFGQDIDAFDSQLIYPHGDALRDRHSEQEKYNENKHHDSTYANLDANIATLLKQLVHSYNLLITSDPFLQTKDEAILDPDLRGQIVEPPVIHNTIKVAVNNGIITNNAKDAILNEAKLAPTIPDPENRKTRRSSQGFLNSVREWFAWASKNYKIIAKGIETGKKVAEFLARNENLWFSIFGNQEWLNTILEILKKTLELLG